MKRLHAIVSGRVQGVSFRYFTQNRAKELRLKGWVRNLDDGRVETIAEGDAEKLNEFLAFLHQGPTGAWVMGVEEEWLPPLGDFTDFKITY